ncbi:MAG TPA: formate/nitrite transporter family protein [Bryobacteraceae bacterium]|nr:formate/nitrite transporter family protein [Bryobacteraceae bacterium]
MQTNSVEDQNLATPDLSAKEAREADKRVAVTAHVVHEAIRIQGDEELGRPAWALAWSGLAAGLSMSFSLIAQGLIRSCLPDTPWRTLLTSFGYTFGYLIVIIARQQLFTENTLTAVIPVLARRNWETLLRMLRLWTIVLIANLVGAHLAAWAIADTPVFSSQAQQAFAQVGREAAATGPGAAILKGIFAGWLIALVVWMIAATRGGHIAITVILIYFVGLAQFTHVIAGSIDVLFLVLTGTHAWMDWLVRYLLPTLLGNVIGGVSLVALLNHAQVVAGHAPGD